MNGEDLRGKTGMPGQSNFSQSMKTRKDFAGKLGISIQELFADDFNK